MNINFDIIFLGDSLTSGYGVSKENSWVFKLTQYLSCKSINKGCNGDTTPSMLTRYYNDVIANSPSIIFIMCGTNDLLLGRSVTSIISNIEVMIKDAININSKIIIGIPPAIIGSLANKLFSPSPFYNYAEKEIIKLKDSLIDLCKKYNLYYINFYDITLDKEDIYLDGLHLNSLGHDLMYNSALKTFNNIYNKNSQN